MLPLPQDQVHAVGAGTLASVALAFMSGVGAVGRVIWKRQIELTDKQIETSEELGKLKGAHDGMLNLNAGVLNEISKLKKCDHEQP